MNIDNITSINNIIINGKIVNISIYYCFFFMLLSVNFFEMFPKHNRYGFKFFFFELIYFCGITK